MIEQSYIWGDVVPDVAVADLKTTSFPGSFYFEKVSRVRLVTCLLFKKAVKYKQSSF